MKIVICDEQKKKCYNLRQWNHRVHTKNVRPSKLNNLVIVIMMVLFVLFCLIHLKCRCMKKKVEPAPKKKPKLRRRQWCVVVEKKSHSTYRVHKWRGMQIEKAKKKTRTRNERLAVASTISHLRINVNATSVRTPINKTIPNFFLWHFTGAPFAFSPSLSFSFFFFSFDFLQCFSFPVCELLFSRSRQKGSGNIPSDETYRWLKRWLKCHKRCCRGSRYCTQWKIPEEKMGGRSVCIAIRVVDTSTFFLFVIGWQKWAQWSHTPGVHAHDDGSTWKVRLL